MLIALVTIAASSLLTLKMTQTWQLYLLWGVVNGTATGAIAIPLAAIVVGSLVRPPARARRRASSARATRRGSSSSCRRSPGSRASTGGTRPSRSPSPRSLIVVPVVVLLRARPPARRRRPRAAARPSDYVRPEVARNPFRSAVEAFVDASRSRTFWLLLATLLHLRAHHERADPDAPDPRGARPRHHAGHRGRAAGADRCVRHRRLDRLGLAHRPLRPPRGCSSGTTACAASRCSRCRCCSRRAHPTLVIFAVFYGLDWVATVPPTIALTATTFGRARTGDAVRLDLRRPPARRRRRGAGRRARSARSRATTTGPSTAPACSRSSPRVLVDRDPARSAPSATGAGSRRAPQSDAI